jgi:hypothetical protein
MVSTDSLVETESFVVSICNSVNISLPCATDADRYATHVTMATVVLRSASSRTTKRE